MDKLAIYNLGNQLGLNNKEIRRILNYNYKAKQQTVITIGPWPPSYPGTHYGTISFKDF